MRCNIKFFFDYYLCYKKKSQAFSNIVTNLSSISKATSLVSNLSKDLVLLNRNQNKLTDAVLRQSIFIQYELIT